MSLDSSSTTVAPSISKSKTENINPQGHNEKPQNYYEGRASAKQLSESISDFLGRLKPSTTTPSAIGDHWIWIYNSHPQDPRPRQPEDVATFRQVGSRLLEKYLSRTADVEADNPNKPLGTITRLLRNDRLALESDLRDLAKDKGVTNGKWMLFPRESEVDRVWDTVAKAVWEGKLGIAAKVATAKSPDELPVAKRDDMAGPGNAGGVGRDARDQGQRLICIYTRNFSDKDDVQRVLRAIKDLGLLQDDGFSDGTRMNSGNGKVKTIYYKCDAYTYLDIGSGNEFKLKPSLYSSRDFFPEWYPSSRSTGAGRGGYRRGRS